MIQKLVDYKLEDNLFPNDELITATYMQHPRPDIEAMFPVKTMGGSIRYSYRLV